MTTILLTSDPKPSGFTAQCAIAGTATQPVLSGSGTQTLALDIAAQFAPLSSLLIYQDFMGRWITAPGSDQVDSKDFVAWMQSAHGVNAQAPLFVLCCGNSADRVALVATVPTSCSLPYTVAANPNRFAMSLAADLYPELTHLQAAYKAKIEAMSQICIPDAVMALEQQVDLLTYAVLELFAALPATQQPAWFAAVSSDLTQAGVQTLIPQDAMLANIVAVKSQVRAVQKTYLAAAQAALAAAAAVTAPPTSATAASSGSTGTSATATSSGTATTA